MAPPGPPVPLADGLPLGEKRRGDEATSRTGRRRSDRLQLMLLMALPHEVRRGLSVISLLAEDRAADPRQIVAETRRLDRLIATIADVARVLAGSGTLPLQPVHPHVLVAGAAMAFRLGPDAADVAIDLPGDLPEVLASPSLVERVLVNLLTNAAHHGAPPIEISTRLDQGYVEIAVSDRGPGMPGGLADARTPTLGRPSPDGWRGVGLAASRLFAEEMGGSLHVDEAFRGCRVVLRLQATP